MKLSALFTVEILWPLKVKVWSFYFQFYDHFSSQFYFPVLKTEIYRYLQHWLIIIVSNEAHSSIVSRIF